MWTNNRRIIKEKHENNNQVDVAAVWVYGKVDPGWYMAKSTWDSKYAEHLRQLGYAVKRSADKPTEIPD